MGMTSIRKIELEEKEEKPNEVCTNKGLSPCVLKRKISIDLHSDSGQKVAKIEEKKIVSPSCCRECNKKLKFINTYLCRCGYNFCVRHRFNDQHNCTFDFKSEAKKILRENNPKIQSKKLL